MTHYMVTLKFPDSIDNEFRSLVRAQRAHVNTLMERGIVTTYSLAHDRSRVWSTILAESEEDVWRIVDALPLRKFVVPDVVQLAFHDVSPNKLLTMSLN